MKAEIREAWGGWLVRIKIAGVNFIGDIVARKEDAKKIRDKVNRELRKEFADVAD